MGKKGVLLDGGLRGGGKEPRAGSYIAAKLRNNIIHIVSVHAHVGTTRLVLLFIC